MSMLHILPSSLRKSFLSVLLCLLSAFCLEAQAQLSVSVINQTESCNDNGSAALAITGGTAPYTAYWIQYVSGPTGGGPDTVEIGLAVSNLPAGYYQVSVRDATPGSPLTAFTSVFIRGAFSVLTSVTPATCSNADGKVVATVTDTSSDASGPYSYEWSNGVNNLNSPNTIDSIVNVLSGNYSLTVTDGNGCIVQSGGGGNPGTGQEGIFVWATSPVTATSSATPSNCFDGTATVTPSGGQAPYSYVWQLQPVQTTQTATGLSPGFVQVRVTDANGCIRDSWVSIPAGPNYLQVNSTVQNAQCGGQAGSISANVTGGQAPYQYSWSNGASGSSINGLAPGPYTLTVTDDAGCSITIHKFVQNISPVVVSISPQAPGCGLSDGVLTAGVSGGTEPYTYNWSNGGNSSSVSGLPEGYYWVTVQDQNGCSGSDAVALNEPISCQVRIRGKVVNDINGDCVQANDESGLANVLVNASPGANYATTSENGSYSILTDPGNYQVHVYPPNGWSQICPNSPDSIAVIIPNPGQLSNGNDFYLQPAQVFNDVRVSVSSGPARPGFQMVWFLNVFNEGSTTLSPSISFTHEPEFTYGYSTPSASGYNAATRTATWNPGPISPNSSRVYYVYGTLSASAVLGDSVSASASAVITGTDATPANNSTTYSRLITGSYDPNDKTVTPAGFSDEGFIMEDEMSLYYRIRFQNTGTDTAFTVVVRDTLDTDLDVPTFRVEGFSHPMTYSISGPGILTFRFDNILLPDSFVNEPRSHGFVTYSINRKINLAPGTQITNAAGIYFDFNPPIITNTTLNTIWEEPTGLSQTEVLTGEVFPNPGKEQAILRVFNRNADYVRLSLEDLSGRTVWTFAEQFWQEGMKEVPIGTLSPNLQSGVYLIRLQGRAQSGVVRWVVSK